MSEGIDNATTMTVTEYARHRGVDQALISRWKAKGRLVLDSAQRVLVRASDAVLERDLHPTKGGRAGSRAASAEGQGVAPAAPAGAGCGGPDGVSYTDAARAEKMQRVRLLGMEISERAGKLVQREDVERQAFARARQALEALLAIPDRLAPLLAAETDPHRVHVMLDDELRRVAAQLAGTPEPHHAEAA